MLFGFNVNPTLINIFCGCLIVWLIKYLFNFINRIHKLPPGPWGLPIVGYLPFIKKDAYIQMTELAKKYGPVFSFKCGQFDVVVINGTELMKEALVNEQILDRPKDFFTPGMTKIPSLVEMSGEVWRQQRRVALTIFRNVGLGKSKLEEKIKEEINFFTRKIDSFEGKKFNFDDLIHLSVANVVSIILFGHRYDYEDPFAIEMANSLKKVNQNFHYFYGLTFLPSFYNFISSLSFLSPNYKKMVQNQMQLEDKVTTEVKEHLEKGDSREINDYIDGYLEAINKQKGENNYSFNLETLRRNVADFYAAGSDTIAATLKWIMLYLVLYPECQQRIQDEIKETIGSEREPEYADRQQMPYTMAFLYESLRLSSIVALNVYRRATRETHIAGYIIPKDAFVVMNFWSVHRDPNLWDDPDSFKPERFLNEDGSKVVKSFNFFPFSAGKRVCPGENLSWMELFLYLVSILQKFRIAAPEGERISLESKFMFTISPKKPVELVCKRT
ncbi:cytochrome P450 2J6-like [Tetranychus urticae]|uniref:Cytochrome P450 392D4 n=1 Tax=Tetranychus urticae TaxID=32264 RepID=T1JZS1_TETUR|nr:cytochrome P450 2J6-like [Tetranychus urticae]QOV04245.1 cytochrome P450 392D4 [Tetranychus urticae]